MCSYVSFFVSNFNSVNRYLMIRYVWMISFFSGLTFKVLVDHQENMSV